MAESFRNRFFIMKLPVLEPFGQLFRAFGKAVSIITDDEPLHQRFCFDQLRLDAGPMSSSSLSVLYEEIAPHTGMRANSFSRFITASEIGPPTLSK